jgi:putative ABC transport system ATP-binding protein
MTILKANQVHKSFSQGGTAVQVLSGLELDVKQGETVAIVGQSGSGKSTLLSLLAGLDSPTSGSIELAGRALSAMSEEELTSYRAKHLGIVFQQFHLMGNLTAIENVSLPLEIARDSRALDKAKEALEHVGLAHRAKHFPHQLSGGERQRVAIARALVIEPSVLLADEPSGSLDTATGQQVMSLLFDLVNRRNMTLVLVTHNEELVKLCQRTLTLRQGRLESPQNGGKA